MVEHDLAKVGVASSSLVSRSTFSAVSKGCAAAIVFGIALVGGSCATPPYVEDGPSGGTIYTRMPDGKLWMVVNAAIPVADSYCYADSESHCSLYGRLYTFESAQQACLAFRDGSRLPTDDEWRELARQFGGIFDDAQDRGSAAYHALLRGGSSGFEALLSGGRDLDGQYDDLDAHGFYWTASAGTAGTALFYNFGKGSTALYRQLDGEQERAFAVRCVRDG